MRDRIDFKSKEIKVKYLSGEFKSSRSGDIRQFGVRDFNDNGKMKFACSLGEMSPEQIEKSLEDSSVLMMDARGQLPTSDRKGEWLYDKGEFPKLDEISENVEKYSQMISSRLPNFVVEGSSVVRQSEVRYTNSLDSDLYSRSRNYQVDFSLRRKGSANICDAFIAYAGINGFKAEKQIDFNLSLLETFDNEVKVTPGKHKVLIAPDGPLTHKVGESLRADLYHSKSALYSGKLGEKIFDSKVSFSDLRDVPSRDECTPFDYEGNVCAADRTKLIENGIFCGMISDLKNENEFDVKSTANGLRSYNSQSKLGFVNLALEAGDRSAQEVLSDHDEVIVTLLAAGGDITAEGQYASPMQFSYLVKNGKPIGRVNGLSISTHLEKFFGQDLIEISNSFNFGRSSGPYCLVEADIQC